MMKLLIVDDHPGMRELIRQLAALPAGAVRECADGREAVEVAREFRPDLVTMDLRLPELGGIEATRALRAVCPAASVIIVTTYDQPAMREAATTAGATHFVAKDNLAELRPMLARLAGGGGAPMREPQS
jgi:CheY-like chemotaxis protein